MTELLRVRLPATLKELLRQRAVEDGRSMNGQLVQILKGHLYNSDAVPGRPSKKEPA